MISLTISLFALFIFWLLLSGMFVPFLVAAGLGSAVAVVVFSRRMRTVAGVAPGEGINAFKLLAYLPWLFKEIIVSAWDVTKRILHPRLPISPALVEFTPSQKTEAGLVVHANSITLTPGTISVEVEPGRFLVHALTTAGGDALAGSEMDRRCRDMENRP